MPSRSFTSACVLFSLVLLPLFLSAKHIIGGEITYRYLGPGSGTNTNRYEFTMKIYRDCNGGGADFDSPAQFAIYHGSYTSNDFYTSFSEFLDTEVFLEPDTPQCVSQFPSVCVQRAIYTFTRDLPVSDQSYFIDYQRCCRNETISNLINPGDQGATYFVEITPEAQANHDSSPVFTNFPPIVICNNIPLDFDHSATDADGDLLIYHFCTSYNGGGPILSGPEVTGCDGVTPTPPCPPPFDPVNFVVPAYSPSAPMGGSPTISIDDLTGFITGTPTKLGQYVVGVCVDEYRNGQLIGTVRRDFQFNVADCSPTVLAKIENDSVAGPKQYVLNSCGNNTITFENLSGIISHIHNYEWRFDLKNGDEFFSNSEWSPTVTFPDTGSYQGTLILNPGEFCGDTADIFVNIYPAIHADFTYDYDTCIAGPVAFTDKSTGDGGINRWRWTFGVPGGVSTEQNPDFLYPIPGDHPVRLRVYDQNNCSDDTIQNIHWFPAPALIIVQPNTFHGCAPEAITFTNLSSPIDDSYHIVWDYGDGTRDSGVISPTHTYTEPGLYSVGVQITSPIGCYKEALFSNLIRMEPSPVADFIFSPDTLLSNFNNTVQFTDRSTGAAHWNWQFDQYGTSLQQNPSFTFQDTGLMKIRLIVTHAEGCQDSLIKYLDIVPEIRWFMPNAFTPNGDGQNDGFFGKGYLDGVDDFNMTIWNRWGELVFETSDPAEEWNGRVKNTGGWSPAGVYVYLVTFTGPRGQPFEFRGFATVVR